MCIQTAIQSKIAELTDNGSTIAHFLADTLQGSTDPNIKICHRLDAARIMARYGASPAHPEARPELVGASAEEFIIPGRQSNESTAPQGNKPASDENAVQDDCKEPTPGRSIPTLRDIVAYPVARYIRDRTREGDILVRALCRMMDGRRLAYESVHRRAGTHRKASPEDVGSQRTHAPRIRRICPFACCAHIRSP